MNDIVKYQNDMNRLKFNGFTRTDMNIFMSLCLKVKEQGTKEIILTFSELKKMIHYEKKNNVKEFMADLKQMNKKLMNVNCEIITDDEDIMFVLFPTFTIKRNEEMLIIAVNEKFVWLLNEMKNYTAFELEEFINLNSKYSKNLYRLLKQWRTLGKYTFYDLQEFRELMDIPQKYTNKYMMNECVAVAVKEIQKLEKSFENLECTPIYAPKRGKPLEKLQFTWTPEKIPQPTTQEQLQGQENFTDVQTFDEYMKAYQGEDKPSAVAIKIAQDIEKGKKKKLADPKEQKKNSFNNFHQRTYNNEELEDLLLTTPETVSKEEKKKKATKIKKNSFCDFPQEPYDYDELEEILLRSSMS